MGIWQCEKCIQYDADCVITASGNACNRCREKKVKCSLLPTGAKARKNSLQVSTAQSKGKQPEGASEALGLVPSPTSTIPALRQLSIGAPVSVPNPDSPVGISPKYLADVNNPHGGFIVDIGETMSHNRIVSISNTPELRAHHLTNTPASESGPRSPAPGTHDAIPATAPALATRAAPTPAPEPTSAALPPRRTSSRRRLPKVKTPYIPPPHVASSQESGDTSMRIAALERDVSALRIQVDAIRALLADMDRETRKVFELNASKV